jgi:penicillin amidase
LTADGRALLANDMHLGLRAPAIWFRARLRYADARAAGGQVDVSGVSLPGLPGIVAGSNGRVAWGFTNSYGDWLDWVQVDWVDARRSHYRTPEGDEALRVQVETISVAGAPDSLLEVRETRWGPILHEHTVQGAPLGESSVEAQHDQAQATSALALMWTVHRAGAIDLGLLDMAHAADLDQALAVGQRAGMPAQNLLVADHHGRIGWTIAGRIPQRLGDCDAQLPLTPLSGCSWGSDWLAAEEAPRLLDPTDGRLWTANSRVADGEALRLIGTGGYDLGARQGQIRDALRAAERFDERDLLAIQLDDRALFLQRWWKLLREVSAGSRDPALQRLEQATRQWEGRASVDAVSYRVVRAFRSLVLTRIRDDLFAAARVAEGERWKEPQTTQIEGLAWSLLQQRPADWLADPQLDWNRLLIEAAIQSVVELEASGALPQRTWGERNAARICHPLANALPGLLQPLLCRPADPLPGDAHMPRVQGASFGASQRMVVAPGHESEGILHAPAGQSGHPLSPFWDAGHRAWVSGEPTPFLPGEPVHRLRLQP